MITGIILAGGQSKRLGTNKMEVTIGEKLVIEHTLDNMKDVVDFVTLVTGHYKLPIIKETNSLKIVNNKNYLEGMFSSIRKGIEDVDSDIFIIPGDYPMVKSDTYRTLINSKGDIRVPTYQGRKGHPIFIRKELVSELKKEDSSSNLKVFRDKHQVNYIEVSDKGIILDLDTAMDQEILIKEMRYLENENE